MTTENDIVLIHFEDNPMGFARIESITADHKPGWYHVKLLLLQLPLKTVTWILRDTYIDGGEFTMGGKRMRLEKIRCPDEDVQSEDTVVNESVVNESTEKEKQANVISFKDLKK
ncbi:MAG: hypothetical protein R6U50_15120 [Desulfobacterales bacterium]